MNRSIAILLFAVSCFSSSAFSATVAKKSGVVQTSGVAAKVRTDGAIVYSKPDFDSEVLATLSEGQPVRVSKTTTGDFAKFHKVRAGPVLGYIAEIDIQIEGATKKRTHKRGEKKSAEKKKKREEPDSPMMFSRFVGLLVGQVSFRESVEGADGEESLTVYGLKISGPDVVLDGPIMDLNILLHYGAPAYYGQYSTAPPTGFLLLIDPVVLLPFMNRQNGMVYLGAGPVLSISSFKTVDVNGPVDRSAMHIGASFSLGAGFRIEKVAVRFEGKYYLERQSYKGMQLSIQSQF